MKIIKKMYWITICVLGSFFCLELDVSLMIKCILVVIILISPIVYSFFSMLMESYFTKWITIVIITLSNKLSYNDFSKIFIKFIPNFRGKTFGDIIKTSDEIVQYVDKNFPKSTKEKVEKAVSYTTEHLDVPFSMTPLRVNSALQMKISQLILRYFERMDITHKEDMCNYVRSCFANLLCAIPYICVLIFMNTRSVVVFCFIPVTLILVCVFYKYSEKRFKLSLTLVAFFWIVSLLSVTVSPITISVELFLTPLCFVTFLFSQLTLTLTGLWITNRLWRKASIKTLNKGLFVSNRKLIDIVEVKIIKNVRYVWLWITFFLVIFCTVLMYAFIYNDQLNLGDSVYSLLLSISLYFGGGNSNYDSLEGLYFSSEIVISFFVNTLYLANIVRIIFEPRETKT